MQMATMHCMTLTLSAVSRQIQMDFGCIYYLFTLSLSQAVMCCHCRIDYLVDELETENAEGSFMRSTCSMVVETYKCCSAQPVLRLHD